MLRDRIQRLPLNTTTGEKRVFERDIRRVEQAERMTGDVQRVALSQAFGGNSPKVPSYTKRPGVR